MDTGLALQQIVSGTMAPDPETQRTKHSETPDAVDWDGPNDPENPLNWPESRKRINLILLSVLTVIS